MHVELEILPTQIIAWIESEQPLYREELLKNHEGPVKEALSFLISQELSCRGIKENSSEAAKIQFSRIRIAPSRLLEALALLEKAGLLLKREKSAQGPLPYLVLTDASGAFANLCMDYGEAKERNLAEEKAWERDLLETDYVHKPVDKSQYYCPMDKVIQSLTFLLEMGWKVFDVKGRRVLRAVASDLSIACENSSLRVQGKICYQEESADLAAVVHALKRRQRFLPLSEGMVGLFDPPKAWQVLAEAEIIEGKARFSFAKRGCLEELFSSEALQQVMPSAKNVPTGDFQGTLYPYQQEGLDWLSTLRTYNLSGLLADEMGLGKTVQILAFLSRISGPILIVAPTSLLFNWRKECEKFLPHRDLYLHAGPERISSAEEIGKKDILLTSYGMLRQEISLFKQLHFTCVILDEAQNIKNADSQAAVAACALTSMMRLALTGTPVENRAEDLWSIFRFLEPTLPRDHQQIRPFLLRRTKQIIRDQLPEKMEQIVYVERGEEEEMLYESFLAKSRSGLMQKIAQDGFSRARMQVLEVILRLRQMAAHPLLVDPTSQVSSAKWERLFEDLEEIRGSKVLIYSQFSSMLQRLHREAVRRGFCSAYLDGKTQDREEQVRRFQQDPEVLLFFVSLKAGGVGLNLTVADYVLLYDPWWNEAAEAQAIDRAHRLGRKEAVIARRYITAGSIEEKVLQLKEHKKLLAESLLDFDQTMTQEELLELLN